jgi:hypothetical protein
MGNAAGQGLTTGVENTMIGEQSGYNTTTANYNTFIGRLAGQNATGSGNTYLGRGSGQLMTSGALNTILGRFNGNQDGLDIRTASNHVVLSNGNGYPVADIDGTEWRLGAGTYATTGDYISNGGGNTSGYNGMVLGANMKSLALQANTGLPSWFIDIGGRAGDGSTFNLNTADKFRVVRVAAGGSFYGTGPAFEVNSNGCVGLNTVAASTGTGITFPATQSASSDANTLDDYEEGTWTPTFTASTPGTLSVSYTEQIGWYTKIGRQVSCQINFVSVDTTGALGAILVQGLPFAAGSETIGAAAQGAMSSTNIPAALLGAGATQMEIIASNARINLPFTAGAGQFLQINITYTV